MRLTSFVCLALVLILGCNSHERTTRSLSKNATLDIYLVSATKTSTTKEMLDPTSKSTIYLAAPPFVTAADVATVHRSLDSVQSPALSVILTPAGAEKMNAVTSANSGSQIAFVVNGILIATPTIRAPIAQQFQITGVMDFDRIVEQLTTN